MFWKEAVCHENTSGALYKTAERCYRVGRCECGTVRRTYLWIAWEKWIWKNDVFEEEKFIRVIGKGNKERIVPISGKALKEINLWYIDRNLMTIKPGEEDYVFLNRRGAHLTRNMILIMIKNAAYDAGIKKTISPHTLRHSFATALLKGGADLRVIQALLGHEDIGTTEIYTHLETSDLRRAILEHHPRNIKYSEENQVLDSDKTDKRCPNNR